jgi:hypothetical protein
MDVGAAIMADGRPSASILCGTTVSLRADATL